MKRTPYMQLVMNTTYPLVAIEAITQGTIEGVWEKLIAERLKKDAAAGSPLPFRVLREAGLNCQGSMTTPETWLKAAYFIKDSHPVNETI